MYKILNETFPPYKTKLFSRKQQETHRKIFVDIIRVFCIW